MPTLTTNYSLIKPNVNDPVDEDLWGGYLNDDLDDVDTLIKTATDTATAAGVPIGSVVDYCGSSAPSGYLFCYGQAVSRTVTYSALFAAIGTTFGTGDGSTTFNLPDFRGRVAAGKDNMGGTSANRLTGITGSVDGDVLGGAGGEEGHSLTSAENAAHSHFIANNDTSLTLPDILRSTNTALRQIGSGANTQDYALGGGATSATVGISSSSGSGTAHNTVQPTMVVNKIIRYA